MEKIKFYKYYFKGVPVPVIMEAESKQIADSMLQQLEQTSNTNIDMRKLEDVRVEVPILGVSKKKRKGQEFIWVGKDNSSDGWLEKEQFLDIEKRNKR